MDVLSNLNKNIFGSGYSNASSNTINFSLAKNDKMTDLETSSGKIPSYADLKKNENNQKEEPKPFSSNNLINIKQKKSKTIQDPLSYSNYSSSLKKISDPLSQMKPMSTFGYPTKNKASNTKKETANQKEKETTPLKETNSLKEGNTQKEENIQKEEKPQKQQ